ncbi:hypothetical protein [Xanthomonas axonopodis]
MKKRVSISLAALFLTALAVFLMRTTPVAGEMPSQSAPQSATNDDSTRNSVQVDGNSLAHRQKSWASASSGQIDQDFHDTRTRAEAGDPVAQRQLAEMYERCALYSISPENFNSMLKMYADADKANAGRYFATGKRFSHYCNSIDNGKKIPLIAHELWYAEAAKRGDLIAQIKVASAPDSQTDEATYRSLIEKAFKSKDPDAIFALGDMLSLAKIPIELGNYGHPAGADYSEYAWELAACRAGASCGPGSFRMDAACISGLCNAPDFEAVIKRNFIPPAQLKFLERDAERIRFLRERALRRTPRTAAVRRPPPHSNHPLQ